MLEAAFLDTLRPAPLRTQIVGSRIVVRDTVDSTNTRALAAAGDGVVIVAEEQTAGRGRRGRTWHSPAGLGLWFSVGLEGPPDGLPFAGPLAVAAALRNLQAAPRDSIRVKWPNDVLIGGAKCAGVLVESRGARSCVGIGINVNHETTDFPPELQERACSLRSGSGQEWERGRVLRAVLEALDVRVAVLRKEGIDPLWRAWAKACGLVGKVIRSGACRGRVEAIEPTGSLAVRTEDGVVRIPFGAQVMVET